MLHHKHFDCNYGAMHVPLDYFFGTYAGSKEEVESAETYTKKKNQNSNSKVSNIWRGKPAGEEANDTPVHEASAKTGKVD